MRAAIAGAIFLAAILPGAGARAAGSSIGVGPSLQLITSLEEAPNIAPRRNGGHLDSGLSAVATAPSGLAASARAEAAGITLERGSVRVVVQGQPGRVAQALRAVGATDLARSVQGYEASVEPGSLSAIAAAAGVQFVSAAARPFALSVSGQEVAAIHAQAWQSAGITGVGVKVAVIDMGFAGLVAAQSAGDIPASVATADYCSGRFSTETSHGTAVTEVVHEVAPDAQLLLACVDSPAHLADAEAWAIAQGAKIINHSVGWFNSARGDGQGGAGTPDGVVADAAAHGVLWVNAAGDSAQQHWSGTFSDVNSDNLEDFAPADEGQTVSVPAGSQFCAFMRWDAWSGVGTDDYDLYVIDSSTNAILARSVDDQSTGARPTEAACYTPPSSMTLYVAISRTHGAGAPRIDLFTRGGGDAQYQVAAGSITDPAAAPGALAVGAVCWQTGGLESFSSQGPTIDGRIKPDLVATDRMSSGVYGPFDSCTGSSGFAGTSAASPTVAGMAALVSQLYPSATVAQLRDYLASHALDKGPAGTDSQYGAGEALLPSALSIPRNVVAPAAAGTPTPGNTLTARNGTWTGDGELAYSVSWSRCDAAGGNCKAAGLGSTFGVTATDLGSRLRMSVTAVSAIGSTTASALTRVIATTATPLTPTTPPPPSPKPARHGKTLKGTGRPDRLVGTPYDDLLIGNDGNDVLLGGKGNDRLFGNAGRDVLDGGPGLDRVDAGAGNDTVRTRDGSVDVVLCGSGVDTVVADKRDKLTGCEHVRRF